MKFTSISTLVLAAASTTMAVPRRIRDLKPLELANISASIPFTTMPTTTIFGFSLKDPNTNIETKCSSYWSAGQAGSKSYNCTDKSYQLKLFNGIYNIEEFDFGVARADGSPSGRSTLKGESWKCTKGDQEPLENCHWDGIFHLDIAK
ncbi:hypothetical protein PENANT_c001G10124 [Penicillium antarcticum]|uniref:AA1-like domain-containing protein n=1 Tax=Penicillium antarcticum TaxID=416450 RepID=A0A1V6QP96_9EURO|nr:uncharacterized protein N7508_010366 [Penicillium antarcticum]KAJ5295545.1 hypothetical protein N7508_010366 [Penicillium antarcticum]OQD90772.1 hypothetical protein PENANT_c001G10124 [Penicillium antarcticum]